MEGHCHRAEGKVILQAAGRMLSGGAFHKIRSNPSIFNESNSACTVPSFKQLAGLS